MDAMDAADLNDEAEGEDEDVAAEGSDETSPSRPQPEFEFDDVPAPARVARAVTGQSGSGTRAEGGRTGARAQQDAATSAVASMDDSTEAKREASTVDASAKSDVSATLPVSELHGEPSDAGRPPASVATAATVAATPLAVTQRATAAPAGTPPVTAQAPAAPRVLG